MASTIQRNYGTRMRVDPDAKLHTKPAFDANPREGVKFCNLHGQNKKHNTDECKTRANEFHMRENRPLPLPYPEAVRKVQSKADKDRARSRTFAKKILKIRSPSQKEVDNITKIRKFTESLEGT